MAEKKKARIKLGYDCPAMDFDKNDTGSLLVDIQKHIDLLNNAIEKLQGIYDEVQDHESEINMGGHKNIDYIYINGPEALIDDLKAKGLVKYANEPYSEDESSDEEEEIEENEEEEIEED